MHTVKIEDNLYEKILAYCKENGLKIHSFCNDILAKALNDEMYGDAPFMATTFVTDVPDTNGRIYPKEVMKKAVEEFNEKQQNSPENKPDFDKITKEIQYRPQKIKNNEDISIESVESDEEGNVTVKVLKKNAIDHIDMNFVIDNGELKIDEPKTETRPKKRRL